MTNSSPHHHGHQKNKSRTLWVIWVTTFAMIAEIAAGHVTGSMALLADGWHMAGHVAALSVTWVGYHLIERVSFRSRFVFGGGKILSLGGFTSAIMLLITAGWMVFESVERFYEPREIHVFEASVVALIGLVVNVLCAFILHGADGHDHHHHAHDHHDCHAHQAKDLNIAGAYAHVLADALTSVLALLGLGLVWWKGLTWIDPVIGIVGAIMIARWAYGLIREASDDLLDAQVSLPARETLQQLALEQGLKEIQLGAWKIDHRTMAVLLSGRGSLSVEAKLGLQERVRALSGAQRVFLEIKD
jgi:cation diffusion facilitator family transporter